MYQSHIDVRIKRGVSVTEATSPPLSPPPSLLAKEPVVAGVGKPEVQANSPVEENPKPPPAKAAPFSPPPNSPPRPVEVESNAPKPRKVDPNFPASAETSPDWVAPNTPPVGVENARDPAEALPKPSVKPKDALVAPPTPRKQIK